MVRTHRLLLPTALAGALLLSGPAGAGQSSTSFQVTATVGQACTFNVPDLEFGPYTGTAVNSFTEMTIDCGGTVTSGSLTLSSATGFTMLDPTNPTLPSLDYDLYRDAAHGQQILSGQPFSVSLTLGPPIFRIFGEIPTGQAAPDGSYSDTVSVVFNF